ncbi:MAG: hypothetical protein H6662_04775 [Ardenticatenaceae bacterium]|nr:hypothetical protein [Ardenticatenaceae bacterium]
MLKDQEKYIVVTSETQFSPTFFKEFSRQLTHDLKKRIGSDFPADKFIFDPQYMRSEPETIKLPASGIPRLNVSFDEHNVAYLEGDLVDPYSFGYLTKVAWRCKNHPEEQLSPGNPLEESIEHLIEFWWEDLPVTELKQYSNTKVTEFDLGPVNIQVEWTPFWEGKLPDWVLELHTRNILSANDIEFANSELLEVIGQMVSKLQNPIEDDFLLGWMSETEKEQIKKRGYARYFSGITPKADKTYSLHIEFQAISDEIVVNWLQALEKIRDFLSLEKIIIR